MAQNGWKWPTMSKGVRFGPNMIWMESGIGFGTFYGIWIEWDSFCPFFFWSSIAVNRLERPTFWSALTKDADLGAYLAVSGPNILTFFGVSKIWTR